MLRGRTLTTDSAYGHVKAKLNNLKESPVGADSSEDETNTTMRPIYDYLMSIGPSKSGGDAIHWFCSLADPVTVDAATFLLRLFAYASGLSDTWRARFRRTTDSCCECMKSYMVIRKSSRRTFFGAFPEAIMKNFWIAFDQWDLEQTREILTEWADLHPAVSISEAPAPLAYRIVANPVLLLDHRIRQVFQERIPTHLFLSWPHDPPAPGLFYLLMDDNDSIRQWAMAQCQRTHTVPIPAEQLGQNHFTAIQEIAVVIDALDRSTTTGTPSTVSFSKDEIKLWAGFSLLLRYLPAETLVQEKIISIDIRHILIRHLHDVGPQFPDVLRCFLYALKQVGARLWEGEEPTYPQVVFDSIKDNPSFIDVISAASDQGDRPWTLAWFSEFLRSVSDLPIYEDVLAKSASFMCEELQHERFRDVRPIIMCTVARFFSVSLRRATTTKSPAQLKSVTEVFAIHAETLITVAFSRVEDLKWNSARAETREFLRLILLRDVEEITSKVDDLCTSISNPQVNLRPTALRKDTWTKVYKTLSHLDTEGIDMLLSIAAKLAHLDLPVREAFLPLDAKPDRLKRIDMVFETTHKSLMAIIDGFSDSISRYANLNVSSTLLDLFQRPGVVRSIIMLMLSPIDTFQTAAKALIEQGFDVFSRADCFRALLENLPEAAFAGLFDFLDIFNGFGLRMPEACNLAKSLVRCSTDVIQVLCSSPDGLLHSQRFLNHHDGKRGKLASILPKLWQKMSTAISVIFRRTQRWSVFFGNDVMIEWMRDALIFARDMLAQRRVIETAADPQGSRRLSSAGKKMIDNLQEVLLESTRWLRLTDYELLHQSFALLKSLLDCFKSTGIPPNEDSISKLRRHIEGGRKQQKEGGVALTKLDENRLLDLEMALSVFDESEDEVEVISHTFPSEKETSSTSTRRKKAIVEVVIQRPVTPQKTFTSASVKPVLPTVKKALPGPEKVTSTNRHLTKASKASVFTPDDQKRLDAQSSVPKFQKSLKSAASVASSASSAAPKAKASSAPARKPLASIATSSAESNSESESDGAEGLRKLQQSTPKIKRPAERRQIKVMELPKIKKYGNDEFRVRQEERFSRHEQLRRTALRFRPDVSTLHRRLLSWNYRHTDPLPPDFTLSRALTPIPDFFNDYLHYLQILEPLLLMECWAQVVQSKEESSREVYTCTIATRQYVDDWTDVDITIREVVQKDWRLMETDVVLLENMDGTNCTMAKVVASQTVPEGLNATLRCHFASRPDPGLQMNTKWRLNKIFSLTTLHREYAALMALPYFDCLQDVLRPRLVPHPKLAATEIERTMKLHNVNEPQAKAILSSMSTSGFSLIQGPPGTGKTWTICGIVSTFLSQRASPAMVIHSERNRTAPTRTALKKVLLCAPSNAAIDEVAKRLKEGIMGPDAQKVVPKVVRVGAEQAINASVSDISLDQLVERKLNATATASKGTGPAINALRSELEDLRRARQEKQQELAQIRDNTAKVLELEGEIQALNKKRAKLSRDFDTLKDQQKSDFRSMDAARRRCKMEVLAEADIICSTLSGSGHEMLEELDFEMVIVDEAAQAIELSTLIPLKYRCSRCIMVGDPQQLPPTVLSQEASKYLYNQSLFVRLQKHRPEAVHLLSIQYRMHPDISQLPSKVFYQGKLLDGPDMGANTQRPWHVDPDFAPYRFFNVPKSNEESGSAHSLMNRTEVTIVATLYNRLIKQFSSVDFEFRVGVVSMYRAQVQEIRREFIKRFGRDIVTTVHFSTVDGFQGQEKDIIILSCVRAGPGVTSIGFLSDTRRMNVAITRARASLFVVGNAATLERSDTTWRTIIQDARSRDCLIDVDAQWFSRPSTVAASQSKVGRASPTKGTATRPGNTATSLPAGLTTPKALRAAKKGSTSAQHLLLTSDTPTIITANVPNDSKGAPSPPRQKRPAHESLPPRPPPALRVSPSRNSTSSSTKKKKKSQTMFIPNSSGKNEKRPLPAEDVTGGPSANRRRL